MISEKQKMLNGATYDSRDPELLELYHKARKLTLQYNQLDSRDLEKRKELLQDLLKECPESVWIETPFYCDYGAHISIGPNSFINSNCIFIDNNYITIGKNALIAPMVQIYTASHPLKASERIITKDGHTSYLTTTKPVKIGDNVWIGGNSVICPGVTIGNNVTIGAGSVVTKDLPDDVLAFGNPCVVKRKI